LAALSAAPCSKPSHQHDYQLRGASMQRLFQDDYTIIAKNHNTCKSEHSHCRNSDDSVLVDEFSAEHADLPLDKFTPLCVRPGFLQIGLSPHVIELRALARGRHSLEHKFSQTAWRIAIGPRSRSRDGGVVSNEL
jgi:hypothetical protein